MSDRKQPKFSKRERGPVTDDGESEPKKKRVKFEEDFGNEDGRSDDDEMETLKGASHSLKEKKPKEEDDDDDDDETKKKDDEDNTFKDANDQMAGEEARDKEFKDGGFEVEPFNLDEERELGQFDNDGFYVQRRRKSGVSDAWLDEMDKEETDAPKKSKKFVDVKKNVTANLDDEVTISANDTVSLTKEIIALLLPKETITQALKRLRPPKHQKNTAYTDEEKQLKGKFDRLTEASHVLLSSGHYNIYSEKREELEKNLKSDFDEFKMPGGNLSQNKQSQQQQEYAPDPNEKQWEYRIGKDIFGPFGSSAMKAWHQQGYFGVDSGAALRPHKEASLFEDAPSEQENPFVPSKSFDFSQF